MNRIIFGAFVILLSLAAGSASAEVLYSSNGFEQPTFSPGAINGQNGWTGDGVIQATTVFSGAQALMLDATAGFQVADHALSYSFAANPNGVFRAQVHFLHSNAGAQAGLALFSDTGFLAQVTNAGILGNFNSDIGPGPLTIGVWYLLGIEIDVAAQTMTGYRDGVNIGTLPINTPGPPTAITSVWLYSYNPNVVYFDNLQVTAEVPEPASLALWSVMSAAGLAAWRRRRNAAAAA